MKVYALYGGIEYSGSSIIHIYSSEEKAKEAEIEQEIYCKRHNLYEFLLCELRRYIWRKQGYPESGYIKGESFDLCDRIRARIPKGRDYNYCWVKEYEVL